MPIPDTQAAADAIEAGIEADTAGNDTIGAADAGNDQSSSSAEASPPSSATTDSSSEVFQGPGDGVLAVEMPTPSQVSPMQTASVGRIVHYWDNAATGPYAALVTGVVDGEGLQLTVFRPGSTPVPYASAIPYVDDRRSDGPAWRWPDGMAGTPMPLADFDHAAIQALFPGATGGNAFGVSKEG